MDHWPTSCVICLAAAAFASTRLTGMGASLAVLAVYFLAGELRKLQPAQHVEAVFKYYEASFQAHVLKTHDVPFFGPGITCLHTALKR